MTKSYQIEPQSADSSAAITITVYTRLEMDAAKEVYIVVSNFLKLGHRKFVFDLHQLSFCDSQTLALWIMVHKVAVDQSGTVEFRVQENSPVHELLITSKLDKLLTIITDGVGAKP